MLVFSVASERALLGPLDQLHNSGEDVDVDPISQDGQLADDYWQPPFSH
jgi:hypothetical protein